MAYKFQIGSAKLGGNLVMGGEATLSGSLSSSDVDDTTAANIVAEIDNKEIPHTKVALEDGDFLIGDGDGIAQNRTISGDATVSNTGVLTIAANAVEGSMINSNAAGNGLAYSSNALNVAVSGAVKIASDKVGISGSIAGDGLSFDGGVDSISTLVLDANPDSFDVGGSGLSLASNVAGAGLALASGQLSVNIDGLSALGGTGLHQTQDHFMFSDNGTEKKITFSNLQDAVFADVSGDATIAAGGALTIGSNAVEGSMINSNAAGNGLGYSSNALNVDAAQTVITSIYNTALKLGRGATDDNIDFGTDDSIIFNIDNGEKFRVASGSITAAVNSTFEGNVTIEGNLTVTGASVEVQQGFVVTSSVQFEGSTPDGNEISLTSADPSADRTITLPDLTGHVPLIAGAIGNANVTAAEFLLLDGGSTLSTGITISDTQDGFLFNDNGTMKQIRADQVKSYIGTPSIPTANKSDGDTLAVGMNYFNNHGGAIAATCPASAGLSAGDIIRIKAGPDCSSTNKLTINRAGSQTFDATLTSLVLESPNAAISLVYVDTDDFRIM